MGRIVKVILSEKIQTQEDKCHMVTCFFSSTELQMLGHILG